MKKLLWWTERSSFYAGIAALLTAVAVGFNRSFRSGLLTMLLAALGIGGVFAVQAITNCVVKRMR